MACTYAQNEPAVKSNEAVLNNLPGGLFKRRGY